MLFRRAVQGTCYERKAPDVRLLEQIDWLGDQGLISRQLAEVAHEVRHFGNAAAHAGADGLNAVTAEDAEQAWDFTVAFLDYVYVLPHRVEQAKLKRAAPKQS